MARTRDNQRSRVYAWEAEASRGDIYRPVWSTLDECQAFLRPIWRAERGRVGLAGVEVPAILRPSWGQSRALAHGSAHKITLPRWARNPWVVLHEAAHLLTPKDEAHGPRFVGVLIGLLARHDGYVAEELMAKADEMGVRYHYRSIGNVPVRGVRWHVERAIREHGPMSEMDIACWLDVSYMQVRGAALGLIASGRARWLRRRLTLIEEPTPEPPPVRTRITRETTKERAAAHDITIEKLGGDRRPGFMVYPPDPMPGGTGDPYLDDPHEGDHYVATWAEVRARVEEYIELMKTTPTKKA